MYRGLSVWCLSGATLVAAVGCTGSISENAAGGETTLEPGKGPKPPVGPEGKPGAGALSDKDAVPGRAPIRRLTRQEYDNTIRDLLGITTSISRAAALVADTESSTSGFVRGGTITAGDDARAMMQAGSSVAEQISSKLGSLLPCNPVPSDAAAQDACASKFITQFGKRAYRRPLTARETELMQTLYRTQRSAEVGAPFEQAVSTLVGAIIQAPQFLYHWELGSNAPVKDGNLIRYNGYELASKLSYLLWSTMPDDKLFEAADNGALETPEQVAIQTKRMLGDAKAKDGLANFHGQWAEISDLVQIPKDMSIKDYSPEVAQAMLDETNAFIASSLLGSGGSLEKLLTSTTTTVDSRLAKIYGSTVSGTGAQQLNLDPKQRAGLFTLLGFLTAKADTADSHPVKRGDTIVRRTLCMEFKVPENVPPVEEATPGGSTTRERFAMHGKMPCASCHVVIDPIGFAFEGFDAIGAPRTMDQGKPIDSSGTVTTPGGATLTFNNAAELMTQMAKLPEVADCMTTQWMRYMLGRVEVAGETASKKVALEEFKKANFDVRELLVALTRTRTFTHRSASPGEVTQ